MNLIDIIILVCFVPALIVGIRKGFMVQACSLLGIVASIWCAAKFAGIVGGYLSMHLDFSPVVINIIAFALILIIVSIVFSLLGKLLAKLMKVILLGWLDKLLGILLAALVTFCILGVIIFVFDSLDSQWHLIKSDILQTSVLYQKINDEFPVFKENGDAIHFRSVCDSLKTVYPESGYVKALEKEAVRRTNLMELGLRMKNAQAMSYPDLEMPDSQGGKAKLSEVDAKVVLVMFWNAADAAQKMFNIDQLLPLYKEYHPKGFEIYSVNVDADKTLWGTTVRNQQLPWINVCDGFGAASVALQRYNVTALPAFYLISGGELVSDPNLGVEGLKGYLKKNL